MADKHVVFIDMSTQTQVPVLAKDIAGDGSSYALATVGTGSVAASGPQQVGSNVRTVTVTPTMDTSAYANGDVWFDTVAIADAFRAADAKGYIVGIEVFDEDDQSLMDFDLNFYSANVSLGTVNSAPSISDANQRNFLGRVKFQGTATDPDGFDHGGGKSYSKEAGNAGLPLAVLPATGTTTLYMAGRIAAGTPTQSASGVRIVLKIQDLI